MPALPALPLAVEHPHLARVVTRAGDGGGGDGLLDALHLFRRKLDLERGERLGELSAGAGADHRHDRFSLGEHPGDGELGGANSKLVCALSTATTCSDDTRPRPILDPWGGEPAEALPHEP